MKTKLLFLLLAIVFSTANIAARDTLMLRNGVVTVVQVDSVKQRNKPAEKVGDFPVNGKTITVYRGPKGGYFYYTGKVKDGKPEKRYLKDLDKKSKKQ